MTVRNIKSGSVMDQSTVNSGSDMIRRAGKSHVDYWTSRLTKRSYLDREGNSVEVPDWQARISHLGRREFFNLGTPNKAAAAVKARDIHVSLLSAGWDLTLAKFKPDQVVSKDCATVGEYLDAVKTNSELRLVTFETYARKFRTLVAGVFGVKAGNEKFDYVNGGRKKWLQRVDSIRLDRITVERVEKWKVTYLKTAEKKNPLAYKRSRVTINSVIRGAKSLFADSVVAKVKFKLPRPLPLEGVSNVPVERSRYRSTIDPQALLQAARSELAEAYPEQYKIFLLALGAGLRRDEIDSLTWKQIDWQRNVIRIETNLHTSAKSAASEGEVDVDPALLAILKEYMRPGAGEFVIRSAVQPRQQPGASHHYRANKVFDGLILWLRSKGVESANPLHTLRKEFGSLIAAQAGIFAASLALRHADIQLTRNHYLDKKQTSFLAIGKLLDTAITPSAVTAQASA